MTSQPARILPNYITFPQALRDAIPTFQPCAGRVLQLDSAEAGQTTHYGFTGRRVVVKLHVCETGKLEGAFDVSLDLNIAAAEALAEAIRKAAAEAKGAEAKSEEAKQ